MNTSSQIQPRRVMVIGDGYVARHTIASIVAKNRGNHGEEQVAVVAGVTNPSKFKPMEGVSAAVKADFRNKCDLVATLKVGNYCRLFLVLPCHVDRIQLGRIGLEAARDAGIPQVVLVSVLTADTHKLACHEEEEVNFRPLEDDIQSLGMVPVNTDTTSKSCEASTSSGSSTFATEDSGSNVCMRIQRKNLLQGWFPMKVQLLQITLPDYHGSSFGAATSAISGQQMRISKKRQDCIKHLVRAFQGPYQRPNRNMQPQLRHDMDMLLQQAVPQHPYAQNAVGTQFQQNMACMPPLDYGRDQDLNFVSNSMGNPLSGNEGVSGLLSLNPANSSHNQVNAALLSSILSSHQPQQQQQQQQQQQKQQWRTEPNMTTGNMATMHLQNQQMMQHMQNQQQQQRDPVQMQPLSQQYVQSQTDYLYNDILRSLRQDQSGEPSLPPQGRGWM